MGIFDAFNPLIRIARKILEGVTSKLMQQLNVVEEQALNPMKMIVQLVSDGSVWRGEGANAFVEEVSSIMIPGVGQVTDHIKTYSQNLQRALEIVDQADNDTHVKVVSLGDSKFAVIWRD